MCTILFWKQVRGSKISPGKVILKYGREDEIDLEVGLLMEHEAEDSQVGPTSACLIAEQFNALKLGDSHWYERADIYTPDQLAQVKKMSLAKVGCVALEEMFIINEVPSVSLG